MKLEDKKRVDGMLLAVAIGALIVLLLTDLESYLRSDIQLNSKDWSCGLHTIIPVGDDELSPRTLEYTCVVYLYKGTIPQPEEQGHE